MAKMHGLEHHRDGGWIATGEQYPTKGEADKAAKVREKEDGFRYRVTEQEPPQPSYAAAVPPHIAAAFEQAQAERRVSNEVFKDSPAQAPDELREAAAAMTPGRTRTDTREERKRATKKAKSKPRK